LRGGASRRISSAFIRLRDSITDAVLKIGRASRYIIDLLPAMMTIVTVRWMRIYSNINFRVLERDEHEFTRATPFSEPRR
jgi:hypothetical protein